MSARAPKRKGSATDLDALVREFWEASAQSALFRSWKHLACSEPIEERDRLFIATRLEQAFDEQFARMKRMSGSAVTAQIVAWLVSEKKLARKTAEAALATRHGNGDSKDIAALHQAVTRLYKARQARKKIRKA